MAKSVRLSGDLRASFDESRSAAQSRRGAPARRRRRGPGVVPACAPEVVLCGPQPPHGAVRGRRHGRDRDCLRGADQVLREAEESRDVRGQVDVYADPRDDEAYGDRPSDPVHADVGRQADRLRGHRRLSTPVDHNDASRSMRTTRSKTAATCVRRSRHAAWDSPAGRAMAMVSGVGLAGWCSIRTTGTARARRGRRWPWRRSAPPRRGSARR